MSLPECRQRLSRWSNAAFLHIFESLPDSLVYICLCGNIKQMLMGCRILYNSRRLSIHSQNHRPLGSL